MSLSSTGFCRKQGTTLTIETIKTNPKTAEDELARLRYICDEVMKRIPKDVKMICIEDYFTPGNAGQVGAAIRLVALGTVMRMKLYEAMYPFFVIHPSQLKKFATGKGSGQKSIVVREVYKRWGLDCKDDNQADACVLAHMAEGLCVDRGIMPDFQQEVVDKVFEERPRFNCGKTGESDGTTTPSLGR
jgi:crossover junction endodeoxyribonuclease RuvC